MTNQIGFYMARKSSIIIIIVVVVTVMAYLAVVEVESDIKKPELANKLCCRNCHESNARASDDAQTFSHTEISAIAAMKCAFTFITTDWNMQQSTKDATMPQGATMATLFPYIWIFRKMARQWITCLRLFALSWPIHWSIKDITYA